MLRLVIEAVAIRPIDVPQRLTQIRVQWKTGAVDELTADRPGPADHNRTSIAAIQRIRELATTRLVDRAIAEKLNAEGMKSGSRTDRSCDGLSAACFKPCARTSKIIKAFGG